MFKSSLNAIAIATAFYALAEEGSAGSGPDSSTPYLSKADKQMIEEIAAALSLSNDDVIGLATAVATTEGISLHQSLVEGEQTFGLMVPDDKDVQSVLKAHPNYDRFSPTIAAILQAHTDAEGNFNPQSFSDDEIDTVLNLALDGDEDANAIADDGADGVTQDNVENV